MKLRHLGNLTLRKFEHVELASVIVVIAILPDAFSEEGLAHRALLL